MNRYVKDGLLADLLMSRHILYVGADLVQARHALEVVDASIAATPYADLYHVNRSTLRIDHSNGGWVRFTSARSNNRGLTADVVFCDCLITQDQYAELAPITMPTGELINA